MDNKSCFLWSNSYFKLANYFLMAVIKNLISLGQHEYGKLSSKNFKAYKGIPGFEKKTF